MEPLPVWQKGDPQIRLLMPAFWMKMVKPPDNTPKNQVHFITHPQMTRFDVKNYLEKIYKVPVGHVRTMVKLTENKPPGLTLLEEMELNTVHWPDPVRDKKKVNVRYSEEYKKAIVILADGEEFEFPDVESKIDRDGTLEEYDRIKQQSEDQTTADYQSGGVPSWFR